MGPDFVYYSNFCDGLAVKAQKMKLIFNRLNLLSVFLNGLKNHFKELWQKSHQPICLEICRVRKYYLNYQMNLRPLM